jgi:uncharacterized protein YbaR (Trm112 family)
VDHRRRPVPRAGSRPAGLIVTLDKKLLDLLVCPADHGPLVYTDDVLYNPRLRRAYRIDDDIPVLLIDEAVAVSDDEHERLIAQANPEDRR